MNAIPAANARAIASRAGAQWPMLAPVIAQEDTVPIDSMQLPVFDAASLAAVAPDPGIQRRMAQAFLRQLPAILDDIAQAAACDDGGDAWRPAVHKLRGACLAMGGRRLGALLDTLENDARYAALTERARARDALAREVDAFTAVLGTLAAG